MKFWCWLFGHRPLTLQLWCGDDFAIVKDGFGEVLLRLHLCERCRLVYWNYE